jgi:hypothetical protein
MHAGFGIAPSFPSSIQTNPFGSYAFSPYGYGQQQWLQILPQQIQQLQQLAQVQQQQVQQLLQIVPAQLQQVQQVLQIVPQQLQQIVQLVAQQQFGGHAGIGGFGQPQAFNTPFQSLSPYGAPFVGSGHVM